MELVVYILLLLTSVVGLAFIVERGLALRWQAVIPAEIEAEATAASRNRVRMRPKDRGRVSGLAGWVSS